MCYNQLYGLYNYTHTQTHISGYFLPYWSGGETVKIKMIYLASSSSLSLEYLTQFYNMPGIFLSTSNLLIHSIFYYDEKDQFLLVYRNVDTEVPRFSKLPKEYGFKESPHSY